MPCVRAADEGQSVGAEPILRDDPRDIPAEPEIQLFAAEWLAFFTDAVAAIAITLLALQLKVAQGHSWAEVEHSIGARSNEYAAFLISFLIVSSAWAGHHALFRYVKRADRLLIQLTSTGS